MTARVTKRPVVWVTGASRGIGREVAAQFASLGCEVILSGRSMRELKASVKEIRQQGGKAHAVACDVTRGRSVARTVQRIRSIAGDVDVLVNNAGVTAFKSFLHTPMEEFRLIIATNLEGQIACIKAVVPSMVKRKRGWIFNIVSMVALKTFGGSSAYTAAKAGLFGFAKVLREELKSHNIKVVNVLPGATDTAMWGEKNRRRFSFRMMKPKSVAEAVLAAYQMPDDVVVDELVVRPMLGDLE
jgi:short-subunit dehydrogenase